MTRHLSDNEIDRCRRRTIVRDEMIAASEHLSQCDECYRKFNPGSDVKLTYASFRSAIILSEASLAEHLTYEELTGHVDGILNGNQADRCWAHIEMCPACRGDVEELREFKNGARASGESPPEPTVQPATSGIPRPMLVGPGWLARPFTLAALAASILIVAACVVWLVAAGLRSEIASLRAQVAQARAENEALRQNTSELESLRNRIAELGGSPAPDPSGTASSPIVIALKDGDGIVQLHEDGGLTGLESAPEDLRDAARLALKSSRLERPNLQSLKEEPGVLMGEARDAAFSLTSPVGIVIEESRPIFAWSAAAGAVAYRVTITDARSGKTYASPQISESYWQTSNQLPRGRIYSWAVSALLGDGRELLAPAPPAPEAQFRIITASQEDSLRQARRLVPRSHLVEAVLYARAGLMRDARRELEALVEANPESKLARGLLEDAQ